MVPNQKAVEAVKRHPRYLTMAVSSKRQDCYHSQFGQSRWNAKVIAAGRLKLGLLRLRALGRRRSLVDGGNVVALWSHGSERSKTAESSGACTRPRLRAHPGES